MVSDNLIELCNAEEKTIIAALLKDPKKSPGEINDVLYPASGPGFIRSLAQQLCGAGSVEGADHVKHPSPEALERVLRCGKFGNRRPSDLFLKVCAWVCSAT